MISILIALAKSTAMILPVVVFLVIASIVAVRRGEAASHHGEPHAGPVTGSVSTEAAAALPPRELSVIEILLLAAALFGAAMGALLGVSLMGHM
jgi:hypothetical protein